MDITKAVQETMSKIDKHPLSSSRVPPKTTVEFYENLAEELQERASALREEHGIKRGE